MSGETAFVNPFLTVHEAGRYIWGYEAMGFQSNPPSDEHVNFFRAVLAVSSADGVLSHEEKSYAKAAAMMNCLSLKDFDDLDQEISAGKLEAVHSEIARQLRATDVLKKVGARPVIYYATRVAALDGLAATERKAVHDVASFLEISPAETDTLISHALKEKALSDEKVALLFPNGSPYHKHAGVDFGNVEEACRGYWAHVSFGMTEVPPVELSTAMIRASLAVAAADGVLSTQEKTAAAAAAIVTGLSNLQFVSFVKEIEAAADKTAEAVQLLKQIPEEYMPAALYYACRIAAADGFDIDEVRVAKAVAVALGVDEKKMDAIVDLTKREKKTNEEKVDAVFPNGTKPY